jgi:hypothetical protein
MFADGVLLRHVEDVQKVMNSHLHRLVPGEVPSGQVTAMWQAFDAIERQAAAAKTLLAARVEESRSWAKAGDRSAVEHMARRSGTSHGTARSGLETSKRLARLPATEAALRRGELSPAQADTISEAASVNPGAEQALLQAARHSPLARLREQANRAKAAGDPDPDATHRRLHRQRRLRRFTDGEGAWNLQARGTADAGAVLNAALDPIIDEIFRQARRDDRHETRDNYAFDALIELARRARGPGQTPLQAGAQSQVQAQTQTRPGPEAPGQAQPCTPAPNPGPEEHHAPTPGPARAQSTTDTADNRDASGVAGVAGTASTLPSPERPPGADAQDQSPHGDTGVSRRPSSTRKPSFLALLRVDLDALTRGRVEDGELCEITGVGPVPAKVARRLLGDAVLKLVITRGVDVVNVTHLGRGPTAAQRIALLWQSPACTNAGCTNTLAVQHDHRTPWAEVHETRLDNLDRLCPPCHRLKTHDDWALVEGRGRRPLVPPDDPRHPRGNTDNSTDATLTSAPPSTQPRSGDDHDRPTLFGPDAA